MFINLTRRTFPSGDPLSISDEGAGTDMDNHEQLVARTREDLEPNRGSQKISAN